MGLINEFNDLEYISHYFQPEDNEIKQFLINQQNSFLERLSTICGITLPNISNPIFLFGSQMQLLLHHLDHFPSSEWNHLLGYLYEIYTFKCYSSSNDLQKIRKDHKQLFTNLFQTQTFLQQPFQIHDKKPE
jgi:hypothetical protein